MKLYALFITDYGVSTVGPYASEEEREAAVREGLGDQNADVNDTLLFAELQDDGDLDAYSVDIDGYLSDEDA